MKLRSRLRAAAFSLVEVTLSLGICAFCLVSLVAIVPTGMSSISNAAQETQAMNVATAILSDLRMSTVTAGSPLAYEEPSSGRTYLYNVPFATGTANFNFMIPNSNGDEQWTSDTSANGRYRVRVVTRQDTVNDPFAFTVRVSWPGNSLAREQGSVTVFGRSR